MRIKIKKMIYVFICNLISIALLEYITTARLDVDNEMDQGDLSLGDSPMIAGRDPTATLETLRYPVNPLVA